MSDSVNYQCLACGGPLRFDGATQQLVCDFCESTFSVQQVEAAMAAKEAKAQREGVRQQEQAAAEAAERTVGDVRTTAGAGFEGQPLRSGDPIADYLANAPKLEDEVPGAMAVQCAGCGATLMGDSTLAVSTCPYCGNNVVNEAKLSGVLKPDYVIPFATSKQDAINALQRHYQGKTLLPKAFIAHNHIEEVQGVYVPFWLYSGTADGTVQYSGQNVRVWADSRYTYTETEWWESYRTGSVDFEHVPVDASTRMPDAHMDAIEPYDYSKMVPFSTAYLPGFAAERYDEDPQACANRSAGRMTQSLADDLARTVTGFQGVQEKPGSRDTTVRYSKVGYALLPVWMLHTRWNGTDYLFAMNGQTGKLIGDLPIDGKKQAGVFALTFCISAVVLAVLTGLFF